jgi:TonB-dependent receptor
MELALPTRWMSALLTVAFIALAIVAQGEPLRVRVLDAATGQAVPQAALSLSAIGVHEVADPEGLIRVMLEEPSVEAIISASGYYSKRVPLAAVGGAVMPQVVLLQPVVFNLEALTVTVEATASDRDRAEEAASANPLQIVSEETLREDPGEAVGDALSRLAGVSVGSDEAGRGAIRIRGAAASQTRLTLDGQSMAGGGGRGSTRGGGSLNRIPREFLERIDVMKAPTPDMDMDAVGGTVDLRTGRISGSRVSRTTLSAGTTLDDFSGLRQNRLSLTHSTPVALRGTARLGVLVALNANAGNSRAEELRVLNQWPERFSPTLGVSIPYLSRLRVGSRVSDRSAAGLLLGIDLELNSVTRLHLKFLQDQSTVLTHANFHTYEFTRGVVTELTPQSGSFERMRFEKQFLLQRVENESRGFVLGGSHRWDGWVVEESLGYSRASRTIPRSDNAYFVTPRQSNGAYQLGAGSSYPLVSFSHGEATALAPDQYRFSRSIDTQFEESDEEIAVRLDVAREWDLSARKWTFKTGLKGRFREASQDQAKSHWLPGETAFSLADDPVSGTGFFMGGRYPAGPLLDTARFKERLLSTEGLVEDSFSSELDTFASDFSVSEDIQAVYAMVRVESGAWSLIGGVRGEQSEMTTSGYETRIQSAEGQRRTEVIPVSLKRSDGRLFPSLHGLLRLGDRAMLRTSLSRTLQRPDFRDLSPSSRVNLDTRQIRSGNPDLRPFDALAADLGADLLLGPWGEASLSFFEKRIDDFIVDVEGNTVYLDDPGFTRNYPVNGSPARLRGVELGWRVALGFVENWLPSAPTLSLNYTYTDSTARYPGAEGVTVMLPEQLRAVFNINLNWQMRKWSLSLRSRYRGLRLDDLVRPGEDRYESPFWSHSIGMNYRISPEWTVSLNASNISRNDQVAYQGSPDKILTIRPGTLTVSLSVNARFGGRPGRPRAEG